MTDKMCSKMTRVNQRMNEMMSLNNIWYSRGGRMKLKESSLSFKKQIARDRFLERNLALMQYENIVNWVNRNYFVFEMSSGEDIRIPKPIPKRYNGPVEPMEYVTKLNQKLEDLLQKQQKILEKYGTEKQMIKQLKHLSFYANYSTENSSEKMERSSNT